MGMTLLIVVLYLVILIVMVCLGIGIGFLLYWILPGVELGIGVLVGVVATGFCVDFVARILRSYSSFAEDDERDRIILRQVRSRRSSKRNK
jgi:hypothetical protein